MEDNPLLQTLDEKRNFSINYRCEVFDWTMEENLLDGK
jgi:hypothetical protein